MIINANHNMLNFITNLITFVRSRKHLHSARIYLRSNKTHAEKKRNTQQNFTDNEGYPED